jgi:aryl-alcohol dehydrogenase-like predicted oxidoreductase
MQAGLLTDAFTANRVSEMPRDDWRTRSADFHFPQIDRNLALRDALRPVARRLGVTVAAVAVAWTLAWPGVTGAIVGGRRPDQVDGWIGALGLELDAEDLEAIAESIVASGAGAGPNHP